MPRRKRTPEEITRKAKVRELMQELDIHDMSDMNALFKDIKALMADLKRVYAAVDGETASDELEAFGGKWNGKHPKIAQSWEVNWPK